MGSLLISVGALIISVSGLLITIFKVWLNNERRITKLETKVDLYWKGVEKRMANYLTSPHTPEVDHLIKKLQSNSITLVEIKQLRTLIQDTLIGGGYSNDHGKECASEVLIALLDARIELNETNGR